MLRNKNQIYKPVSVLKLEEFPVCKINLTQKY